MWRWVALVPLLALTAADTASAAVAKPRFARNIDTGETRLVPSTARPGSYAAADLGIAWRMSVSITIAVAGRAK